MSLYPYLGERSGLSANHSMDRYNYPYHDRAQRDLAPSSQWQQSTSRPSPYITDSEAFATQYSSHYDYSSSSRSNTHIPASIAVHSNQLGWEVESAPEESSRLVSVDQTNIEYSSQLDYPIAHQQPALPISPQFQPLAELPPPTQPASLTRSPPYSPQHTNESWDDDFYRVPESQSSGRSSAALAPPTPHTPMVKMEQDDSVDPFIMELSLGQVGYSNLSQSLAPPTEVPLRATQASKEMRKMMSVFRLNPFAMHSGEGRGVVQATWSGGAAHALDEEPLVFEFQLELGVVEEPEVAEPLRSFSPDFELHEERDFGKKGDWRDEYKSESVYTASTTPTWELDYPASSEDHYSSPDSMPFSRPSSTSRLHNATSHPYLKKAIDRDNSENTNGYRSCYQGCNSFTSRDYMNRMRAGEASHSPWTPSSQDRVGYQPTSRSSTYASDESPGFDPSMLPAITSANRRWSLPDPHPYPHAPFLVQQ